MKKVLPVIILLIAVCSYLRLREYGERFVKCDMGRDL